MSKLQIGTRSWSHSVTAMKRGQLDSEISYLGVDFYLDGNSLSSLSGLDGNSGCVSIFDAISVTVARRVLLGDRSAMKGFPAQGRIPLIFCSCGDPSEGALTARLRIEQDTVIWDRFSWEHDSFPVEVLPEFPAYQFALDEYKNAIEHATDTALKHAGSPSSIINERFLGDGLVSWLARKRYGELFHRLLTLEIDVVMAPTDIQAPGFNQMIHDIRAIPKLLETSLSTRHSRTSTTAIQRVRVRVDSVLNSAEAFLLPWRTTETLKWLRHRL